MAENYFVYGEEALLVQNKVRELCTRYCLSDTWAEEKLSSWTDLQNKLFTQAMFSEQRVFLMDYTDLDQDKPDIPSLKQILASHGNIFILYANSIPDKRTKVFKLINEMAESRELRVPRGVELERWVTRQAMALGARSIAPEAAAELIYLAGSNMFTLENELVKLINYDPAVSLESVRLLAVRTSQTSIFDLVDSVAKGSLAQALNIVEDLYRGGSAEPYLLHMLARQYRMLFRLLFYRQKGYGDAEIQKIMPMHPFAFQKLCRQAARMSAKHCVGSLHAVLKADYAYKTGQIQGLSLLQSLTAKLAKK